MGKLKKKRVRGNIIEVAKDQDWYEAMSYSGLLEERNFMRVEKKRILKTMDLAQTIDPRGMWVESLKTMELLKAMDECCDFVEKLLNKEMLTRAKKGE